MFSNINQCGAAYHVLIFIEIMFSNLSISMFNPKICYQGTFKNKNRNAK